MSEQSAAADNRIFFRLQRAAHVLKKRADDALLSDGEITTAQAAALVVIGQNAPVSQREVAAILKQNESAMTAMVRRLMALGYIERVRSAGDARRWDLSITTSGNGALKRAGPAFGGINAAIDTVLNKEEISELARMLDAISQATGHGPAN